ncbi:hypothetical protein L6164_036869 [Bauhinia variegata]|uniref:Uncharacterized protein n=1 Tax=Bauhinia variegata TaxID=167791 RepID=A0ACB9KIE0_BAUVA|nr:hypothetical protein L6164_036869 [Bauhinia variegata]
MAFRKPHQKADPGKVIGVEDVGYTFRPKGLDITWGADSRYWNVPEDGPAELIQVSWLEANGSAKVTHGKKYRVKFEVSLKPDSFGWNGTGALIMAKVGRTGGYLYKEMTLNKTGRFTIPDNGLEVQVPANASDPTIYFGLYEVWSGKWKGGLEIYKAIIQPA